MKFLIFRGNCPLSSGISFQHKLSCLFRRIGLIDDFIKWSLCLKVQTLRVTKAKRNRFLVKKNTTPYFFSPRQVNNSNKIFDIWKWFYVRPTSTIALWFGGSICGPGTKFRLDVVGFRRARRHNDRNKINNPPKHPIAANSHSSMSSSKTDRDILMVTFLVYISFPLHTDEQRHNGDRFHACNCTLKARGLVTNWDLLQWCSENYLNR